MKKSVLDSNINKETYIKIVKEFIKKILGNSVEKFLIDNPLKCAFDIGNCCTFVTDIGFINDELNLSNFWEQMSIKVELEKDIQEFRFILLLRQSKKFSMDIQCLSNFKLLNVVPLKKLKESDEIRHIVDKENYMPLLEHFSDESLLVIYEENDEENEIWPIANHFVLSK